MTTRASRGGPVPWPCLSRTVTNTVHAPGADSSCSLPFNSIYSTGPPTIGGGDAERRLSISGDGERRLRETLRRSAGAGGRPPRGASGVHPRQRHARPRDRHRRPGPPDARQPPRRRLRQDRRSYAAHRRGRRGERRARGGRRSDRDPRRRLGHRCGEDGGPLSRQRRHRAVTARSLPRSDRGRRHRRGARRSRRRACARSRSRRPCRPASTRPRPAAPTQRGTSRRATAIR